MPVPFYEPIECHDYTRPSLGPGEQAGIEDEVTKLETEIEGLKKEVERLESKRP